jgi:hypothetical protein
MTTQTLRPAPERLLMSGEKRSRMKWYERSSKEAHA